MRLVVLQHGIDQRLPVMDLAGRPFAEHLPAVWRALAGVDVEVMTDEAGAKALLADIASGRVPATDLLATESDVWWSRGAAERLLRALATRPVATRVVSRTTTGGDARKPDMLAFAVPAAAVAAFLRQCDLTSAGAGLAQCAGIATFSDSLEAVDLDPGQPPTRVENLVDLALVERKILRARACDAMSAGVRVRDPDTLAIRGELTCGDGTEIDQNVIVLGRVVLGDGVIVGANVILNNATIGARSRVNPFSIVEDAIVGADSFIGPYGRVRPGSAIGDSVQIGNFVEVKNSQVGRGSRINHLSFVGDATLGAGATIGAGTITCNHDGTTTQRTVIGEDAYVGSGCELVAPVRIGERARIGAGSTITRDAPAGQLTIARARQVTVERPVQLPDAPGGA